METNTENINQGRPVYFSYARNSSRKPEWEHISDCVDTLLDTLTAKNVEYCVDVKDIGMGDKISKFEEEIGWKSEVVVIIFSDKYFRSPHCMYEFVQIKNALQHYPEKRLMCIKSGDFNLADSNYIMDLEQYWINQKNEYERIEYHRLRNHSGTEKSAWQNGFYLDDIRNLYSFFSAINYSNAATINYENFVGDIVKYYKTTPKPDLTPKPKVHQLAKTEQQTTSTPKPITKQLPIKQIAIAAAVVLAIVIYAVTGDSKSKTFERAVGLFDAGNYSEAVVDFEKLAKKGDIEAQNRLGVCYLDGKGVAQNYEKAVEWFQKAAEQGQRDAQHYLGYCYYVGKGVAQNYEKAVEWYQKAAEKGQPNAQNNLGTCYYFGNGVAQNYEIAVEWFKKAAEQGISDAQNSLGNCYYNGLGVAQNYENAVEWFKKAADQGDIFAQNSLGNCYYFGNGVAQNYENAVEWYKKAAEHGQPNAQANLGTCYYYGRGVALNYEKAVEWDQKAAEQEDANGQNNLGVCYVMGRGVPKNISQAKYWFQKAAAQGHKNAIEELKKL